MLKLNGSLPIYTSLSLVLVDISPALRLFWEICIEWTSSLTLFAFSNTWSVFTFFYCCWETGVCIHTFMWNPWILKLSHTDPKQNCDNWSYTNSLLPASWQSQLPSFLMLMSLMYMSSGKVGCVRPIFEEISVELVQKMPVQLPIVKFSLLVLLKMLRLLFGYICVCVYIYV